MSRGGTVPAGLAAAAAAVSARAAYAALARRPPGGPDTWARTNHRGEPVTLAEGPAAAAAAAAAAVVTPGLPGRVRAGLAVAGAGAAAFGCYDDLAGSGDRRGFRGHLGALARGEVTSGAVKLAGIGAAGLAAAALLGGRPADIVINTGLTAGGANLLNLFDLRPGRAIKVTLASGALLAAGAPGPARGTACRAIAAPAGAALAMLPEDLAERAMLGDAGANALGGMLGAAAAASLPRPARVALLAGIAALTAASEVISFTKVIERTPPLRWLDMLGRRPAAGSGAAPRARRQGRRGGRDPGGGPMARSGRAGTGRRRPAVTAPATDQGTVTKRGRAAAGIGRPAVLIGVLTGLATVVGFGRQLVFAHTVGATALGTAYATANQVPNIIYAIVLGGALTGMVVPVLAGSALAGARAQTRQTASALLTWTLLLLIPVSVAVAVAARPIVSAAARQRARESPGRDAHGRLPDAGRVRAADRAVRAGRGGLRNPPGAPQVHLPGAGPGAVEHRGRRRLPRLRAARRRPRGE